MDTPEFQSTRLKMELLTDCTLNEGYNGIYNFI